MSDNSTLKSSRVMNQALLGSVEIPKNIDAQQALNEDEDFLKSSRGLNHVFLNSNQSNNTDVDAISALITSDDEDDDILVAQLPKNIKINKNNIEYNKRQQSIQALNEDDEFEDLPTSPIALLTQNSRYASNRALDLNSSKTINRVFVEEIGYSPNNHAKALAALSEYENQEDIAPMGFLEASKKIEKSIIAISNEIKYRQNILTNISKIRSDLQIASESLPDEKKSSMEVLISSLEREESHLSSEQTVLSVHNDLKVIKQWVINLWVEMEQQKQINNPR